jgi:F-type H+-transporting ATPase subunit c
MSPDTLKQLAFALAIGLGVIGPGIGIGMIGAGAVQGIARNPQAQDKIQSTMILAMAFAESLAIFALVVGMIINFVK